MNLTDFLLFLTFLPAFTNNFRFKRQDVSYGSPSYKHCECGRQNKEIPKASLADSERIVGGREVSANEYPWMAMLVTLDEMIPQLRCGATLINDQYVLTAAHCLSSKHTRDQMKVILGQHNFCLANKQTVMLSVEKFVQHPKYVSTKHAVADMMLVKLNMRIRFNAYIRPICLPGKVENRIRAQVGLAGEILGWGLDDNSTDFCRLRKTEVSIYKDCRLKAFYLFCAGAADGNHDACVGDSGGPFQVSNGDGKYEIIGIISSGIACGDAESPGVYADVTYALTWIYKATQDSMFCWK